MTKEAEDRIALEAEKVFALRAKKKAIEEELAAYENDLKADLAGNDVTSGVFNGYFVELQKIAATRSVDTAALKAAGLYEKFSKVKAGYEKLSVKQARQ